MAAGVVVEAHRWTTFPSLSTRNFSKFHYIARSAQNSPNGFNWTTHLDACQSQDPRLFALQPLEDLVGVVAIDIRFLH